MDNMKDKSSDKGVLMTSLDYFFKHPVTFVPISICWVFVAFIGIYVRYFCGWDHFSTALKFLVIYLEIIAFAFIISISGLVLLELMEQYENRGRASIFKAFYDCVTKDLIRALPTIIIWSLLWFIIEVIDLLITYMFRKIKHNSYDEPRRYEDRFSLENAALTLSGMEAQDGNYYAPSSLRMMIKLFKKGLRMVAFIVLAAIAWEKIKPVTAMKKGLAALNAGYSEFVKSFGLTWGFQASLMIPLLFVLLPTMLGASFPDLLWIVIIIYIGFAQSLGMLVEQLSMAHLYLWFKTFENEKKEQKAAYDTGLSLMDAIRESAFFKASNEFDPSE